VTGLLRAELRKVASTRMWWALGLPVAVLAALVNLFGGLITGAVAEAAGPVPGLLLVPLAYALTLTGVFAVIAGVVAAAGEFRHRTITTTYLTAPGRGAVLLAKAAVSALLGAVYGAATALVGLPAGLLGGAAFPSVGPLLATTAIGVVVCALWGALGAAVGVLVGNQVGALVGVLVYLLLVELLVSLLLNATDTFAARRITAYLPSNAGDTALYDVPLREVVGPGDAPQAVELLAGVTDALPWWGAVLVLAAWTGAIGAAAFLVGGRRDVT
jgi:ABC-2 type transport system permease protein